MKLLKSRLLVIGIVFLSLVLFSCEDNDSGVDFVGLEARFLTEVSQRSVTFNNISSEATSFEWDFGDDTTSTLVNPEKTYEADGTYTVTLTATNDEGETSTFTDTINIELVLIVNGDFENGSEGWIQGVDDNNPAPVVTNNGNTYYEVNVTNPNPDQPFLVNLSQKLPITQGETYVLRFDAWSDANRDIIAGIGLSGPQDFTNNTVTVSITDTQTQYELVLDSNDFGAPNARVIFDLNGEAGVVRIDNVSLNIQ